MLIFDIFNYLFYTWNLFLIIMNFRIMLLRKNYIDIIWYSIIFAATTYLSMFVWSSDSWPPFLNIAILVSLIFDSTYKLGKIIIIKKSTLNTKTLVLVVHVLTIKKSFVSNNVNVWKVYLKYLCILPLFCFYFRIAGKCHVWRHKMRDAIRSKVK